jgi:hypothetical protein
MPLTVPWIHKEQPALCMTCRGHAPISCNAVLANVSDVTTLQQNAASPRDFNSVVSKPLVI